MAGTTLFIKNMVCDRCIRVVRDELKDIGFHPLSISLGRLLLADPLNKTDHQLLHDRLQANGFELITDRDQCLVEQIKKIIIAYIHHGKTKPDSQNFSSFLEQELGHNYASLSKLFSSIEELTIEKYLILQKIERVKELLLYDELTLSEIAFQLNYSSVAHLSGQFKKTTGMTPTAFKQLKTADREPIDQIGRRKS